MKITGKCTTIEIIILMGGLALILEVFSGLLAVPFETLFGPMWTF